jgi:hypothetical protein
VSHDKRGSIATVEIKDGRTSSIKDFAPDCIAPAGSTEPLFEEVTFVLHTIKWTFTDGPIRPGGQRARGDGRGRPGDGGEADGCPHRLTVRMRERGPSR